MGPEGQKRVVHEARALSNRHGRRAQCDLRRGDRREWIRHEPEAREAAQPRLTQEQLSKKVAKLGVSIDRAGIAKIETGIRGVLDFEAVALAKALGVKSRS